MVSENNLNVLVGSTAVHSEAVILLFVFHILFLFQLNGWLYFG